MENNNSYYKSPFDDVSLASWNACGLKVYRDEQSGHLYVKNLIKLSKATRKGFIIAIKETRLTEEAEKIIRK